MNHHSTHTVEVITIDEARAEMRVSSTGGQLLGEFFIAKLPEQTAEEVAQSTYNSVYGEPV